MMLNWKLEEDLDKIKMLILKNDEFDILLGMDYFNFSNACIYPVFIRRGIIKFDDDDDDDEINDYEDNRNFISNNDSEIEFDRFDSKNSN